MVYTRTVELNPEKEKNVDLRARIKSLTTKLSADKTALYIPEEKPLKTDSECYEDIVTQADKFIREPNIENEDQLASVLEQNNMMLCAYAYQETSQDKRDVARMAFNGYVDRPLEFKLSPTFRELKNYPLKRAQTKAEDYDLSFSSVWNVFKKVPEFAAIEEDVKKGLSRFGVPPEKLADLNLKDFCFVINEQFRSSKGDKAKVFSESYKAKHTKRFIAENEAQFRKGLLSMEGTKPEYVDTLVAAMKRGMTDLTKLKDRNGNPVWKEEWANQPVVDVHHIVNVKDAAVLESQDKTFADVNNYTNMCFIVRHPSHDAMHALEHDLNGNYHDDIFYNRKIDQKHIYRIQPPEGVKCMMGFDKFIFDRDYLGLPKEQQIAAEKQKPGYYKNSQNKRFEQRGYKRQQYKFDTRKEVQYSHG